MPIPYHTFVPKKGAPDKEAISGIELQACEKRFIVGTIYFQNDEGGRRMCPQDRWDRKDFAISAAFPDNEDSGKTIAGFTFTGTDLTPWSAIEKLASEGILASTDKDSWSHYAPPDRHIDDMPEAPPPAPYRKRLAAGFQPPVTEAKLLMAGSTILAPHDLKLINTTLSKRNQGEGSVQAVVFQHNQDSSLISGDIILKRDPNIGERQPVDALAKLMRAGANRWNFSPGSLRGRMRQEPDKDYFVIHFREINNAVDSPQDLLQILRRTELAVNPQWVDVDIPLAPETGQSR